MSNLRQRLTDEATKATKAVVNSRRKCWLVQLQENDPKKANEVFTLVQEWLHHGNVWQKTPVKYAFANALSGALDQLVGSRAIVTLIDRIKNGDLERKNGRIVYGRSRAEAVRAKELAVAKTARPNARKARRGSKG